MSVRGNKIKIQILQKDMPLEKLYAGQEATVKTRHGTMDCFKIEKGVYCQAARSEEHTSEL